MRRQLKPGLLFPYARIAHEKGPGYEASLPCSIAKQAVEFPKVLSTSIILPLICTYFFFLKRLLCTEMHPPPPPPNKLGGVGGGGGHYYTYTIVQQVYGGICCLDVKLNTVLLSGSGSS